MTSNDNDPRVYRLDGNERGPRLYAEPIDAIAYLEAVAFRHGWTTTSAWVPDDRKAVDGITVQLAPPQYTGGSSGEHSTVHYQSWNGYVSVGNGAAVRLFEIDAYVRAYSERRAQEPYGLRYDGLEAVYHKATGRLFGKPLPADVPAAEVRWAYLTDEQKAECLAFRHGGAYQCRHHADIYPPESTCGVPHHYTVQRANDASALLYCGPDRAAAVGVLTSSQAEDARHAWLSAEHAGSAWCKAETDRATADAGIVPARPQVQVKSWVLAHLAEAEPGPVAGARVKVTVPQVAGAVVPMGTTRLPVRVDYGEVVGPVEYEPGMTRVRMEATGKVERVLTEYLTPADQAGDSALTGPATHDSAGAQLLRDYREANPEAVVWSPDSGWKDHAGDGDAGDGDALAAWADLLPATVRTPDWPPANPEGNGRWCYGDRRKYDWKQCRYCLSYSEDCRAGTCMLCGSVRCNNSGECKVCHYGYMPNWSRLGDDRLCGRKGCEGEAVAKAPRVGRVCLEHAHTHKLRLHGGRTLTLIEYARERVAHRDSGKGWEKFRWIVL